MIPCEMKFYIMSELNRKTRCVCETQMPPIMGNSKDGQGHKDKYLDTSRNIDIFFVNTYNNKLTVLHKVAS